MPLVLSAATDGSPLTAGSSPDEGIDKKALIQRQRDARPSFDGKSASAQFLTLTEF